jgi:hypothetical protein
MAAVLIVPAQVTGNTAKERMVQRIKDHVDAETMLPGCSRGEVSIHPGSAFAQAVREEVAVGNLNPEQIERVVGSDNAEAILSDYEQGARVPTSQLIGPIIRAVRIGEAVSQIATCSPQNRQDMTAVLDELQSALDGQMIIVRDPGLSRAMSTGWFLKENEGLGF